jgi:hypothetical protein
MQRFQNVMLKLEKEILIYKYKTPLIILSDPFISKNERYLVFMFLIKHTDLGDFESLVVVLTKIKKRIMVDRACQ